MILIIFIISYKSLGVILKKTTRRLPPKKSDVRIDLAMILNRRISFAYSSSSDDSICKENADDWNSP